MKSFQQNLEKQSFAKYKCYTVDRKTHAQREHTQLLRSAWFVGIMRILYCIRSGSIFVTVHAKRYQGRQNRLQGRMALMEFFSDFTFLHLTESKYYKEPSHVVMCCKNGFFQPESLCVDTLFGAICSCRIRHTK